MTQKRRVQVDRTLYAALYVINDKLNRILTLLGDQVMPALDNLTEQVARVEASADAIVAKLEGADPAALQALADRLKAVADKLDDAAASAPPA